MESQLFQHFFPLEEEESGALTPLVEPLCMVLYDMLRPAFIQLQDLDDLCELVDILQHEARPLPFILSLPPRLLPPVALHPFPPYARPHLQSSSVPLAHDTATSAAPGSLALWQLGRVPS